MKKHINLYDAYLEGQKGRRSRSKNLKYVVVLLALGLIIGGYGTKLTLDRTSLQNEIQKLSSYVTNTSNQDVVKKAEAIQTDISTMTQLSDALDNIVSVFDEKQSISGAMIKQITQALPNGVTLKSIGFHGAAISLTIASTTNNGPSEFVDKILKLDFVETVDYKGYTSSGNVFSSNFLVVLKGDY
ncbi:hypothetical protein AOC36_04020 [Erysipelothrix larvae]|uniref:Fimbrial assembly protein n=1 Tax=Erysipelothrix larvae TaxID=1514105 RepID=A0A109UGV3_9FIRM|nr:hypothetical protein [Erysipelothrix larvae]AMC93166.1 hypothetical protein AOC36_04020 [Erysipelothrix larvae]